MTLKVLFLAKYGAKAAATRYRIQQFIPFLEAHGIDCRVSELFDDRYLERRFSAGSGGFANAARGYLRRALALLNIDQYDLAVLHYEALPYLPMAVEWGLGLDRVPYVVEYDDAIFHMYDRHRRRVVRRLLGGKIRTLMQRAAHVIAGNEYLATYARTVNPQVTVIPTAVDLNVYQPGPQPPMPSGSAPVTVGWIGSPSTAPFVRVAKPALKNFFATHPNSRMVMVGSGPFEMPGVPLEVREWVQSQEVADIQGFDIGIMPLPDEPWMRGKCGFKLIQYMGCAKPVIASPVGVNEEIVAHGQNGLLAGDTGEWEVALRRLAESPELRREMGDAGRERVQNFYSLDVVAPRLLAVLRQVAATFSASASGVFD